MAVVADVDSYARKFRFEDGIAEVSGSEIEFFPESGMHVGDVVLAIFAQILAVGINDCGGVEVEAGHLLLVNRDHDRHAVLGCELLH